MKRLVIQLDGKITRVNPSRPDADREVELGAVSSMRDYKALQKKRLFPARGVILSARGSHWVLRFNCRSYRLPAPQVLFVSRSPHGPHVRHVLARP